MAGSILEIRKKIEGVKNTRKITKAMQLVAASKMRQFQKRAVATRQYVFDLFSMLHLNLDNEIKSPYTEKRDTGGTLFVLYTSDKGLCGPLNNKLINALFRSKLWQEIPHDERKLITIGKKSQDYAKSNKIHVSKHYGQIPEKLSALDSIKIVEGILELWKEEKIKQVVFVAPHYKNSFTFYPVLKTFLPFSQETIETTLGPLEDYERPQLIKEDNFMLFEPSEEEVLNTLYEQMIQALFMQSFLELKASEYSSRMIAMQSATEAADRITTDLTREYNKVRQAVITQEIAELMGASLSMT